MNFANEVGDGIVRGDGFPSVEGGANNFFAGRVEGAAADVGEFEGFAFADEFFEAGLVEPKLAVDGEGAGREDVRSLPEAGVGAGFNAGGCGLIGRCFGELFVVLKPAERGAAFDEVKGEFEFAWSVVFVPADFWNAVFDAQHLAKAMPVLNA